MVRMQAMMKRIMIFALLLSLCACGASSRTPWERSTHSGQAQRAPSSLTAQAQKAATDGDQGTVYMPYTPGKSNAELGTYEENAAADQTDPYGRYQSPDRTSDFDVTIGQAGAGSDRITSQQEEVLAAPSLPPVKVALLLPLSGEHADLGQAMLQAAQLALFDMGYNAFELMPRDTAGMPQDAAQAAQSAINDGAQLILGPLFSSSVRAVKPVASRYNMNMITFSTDWSLAGNNVYVMGFLPFAQVQRVSEYAAANGFTDIGILAPNTDYGNAVIAAYNSLAYRTGLKTANVVRFSAEESDSSTVLRSFTQYDERVQALDEYKAALEDRLKFNPNDAEAQAELTKLGAVDTWGELPFQAVLMPIGGDQARSVANLLSFYDLGPKQVKRLGTGLWDDPGLATEPALDGAWFAAPSPDLRKDFESRYRDLFGSRPPRLSSLAYDATALAAVLAKKSYYETGRPSFDRDALANPNGFAGIDGIFRFRPDGLIERGLAVLEYNNGNIKVIDPAPNTFQSLGY